jgi:hypothetical protein
VAHGLTVQLPVSAPVVETRRVVPAACAAGAACKAGALTSIPSADTLVDGRRQLALILDLIPLVFVTYHINVLLGVVHLITPRLGDEMILAYRETLDNGLRTGCLVALY